MDLLHIVFNLLLPLVIYPLVRRYCMHIPMLYDLILGKPATMPESVNFHFTSKGNFRCGSCTHTDASSHIESFDSIKCGLRMLKNAGMKKVTFAGGEPFLHPCLLRSMIKFCKDELCLESVSIVTNGSKLIEEFMDLNAHYIDIITVSCDSFDEGINVKIRPCSGTHLKDVQKVANLCRTYGIKFEIKTVVNRYNVAESMNKQIKTLQPFRWNVFQVRTVNRENDSAAIKRNSCPVCISDEEFQKFCQRHKDNRYFFLESNKVGESSHLMLDEYMRFLKEGTCAPSKSILSVGVTLALEDLR